MGWFKKRRSDDGGPIVFATRAEAEAAEAKQATAGLEPGYGSLRNASGTYYVFRGNDTEKAKQYLRDEVTVTRDLTYYVVETPNGNWGKDIDGLFLENLLPWQYDDAAAEHQGGIIGVLTEATGFVAIDQGSTDNFIVGVRCGNCGHEWEDGVRYQNATAVRCPACAELNRVDSRGITYRRYGDSVVTSYRVRGDGTI
jgi:ribosomal protein S27E